MGRAAGVVWHEKRLVCFWIAVAGGSCCAEGKLEGNDSRCRASLGVPDGETAGRDTDDGEAGCVFGE